MANIVLPLASINTAGNNVNVLTENGGTIYRTKSGDIIKQTLGNLSTAAETDISNLRLLAEQNGELKRISYTGSVGGGGNTTGGESFDVVFTEKTSMSFYFNEWIEVSSYYNASHTYNEILSEMSTKQTIPNVYTIIESQSYVMMPEVQGLSEYGMFFSSIATPFGDTLAVQVLLQYTPTNQIYLLAIPLNNEGDIEFYTDSNYNITCNYSYEDLVFGMAMNLIPSSAKCYIENEFSGMMYFDSMKGESFSFGSFPSNADFSHTTGITYSLIINVNPDNTITFSTPGSTLNEGMDVLWYNSGNSNSVGAIRVNIDPSQYSAFIFTGTRIPADENSTQMQFLPDVTVTTNGYYQSGYNIQPCFYLEGPHPTVLGAYLVRELKIGSTYLELSNGIVALSDSEVYTNQSNILVPTAILGVKTPSYS